MLSLPRAGTYQHNGNGGVPDEVVAYPLTDGFGSEIVIINVPVTN